MQVFYQFFLFLMGHHMGQKGQMPCKLGKHRQIEKKWYKSTLNTQMLNKTPIEKKCNNSQRKCFWEDKNMTEDLKKWQKSKTCERLHWDLFTRSEGFLWGRKRSKVMCVYLNDSYNTEAACWLLAFIVSSSLLQLVHHVIVSSKPLQTASPFFVKVLLRFFYFHSVFFGFTDATAEFGELECLILKTPC